MADTLREIEKGHEAKYKLDEELHFKAQCRGNRLFGLWAARQLGMAGGEADVYARSLVRRALDSPRPDVVFEAVTGDFHAAGVRIADEDVRAACARFHAEAVEAVQNDYPMPLDTDHVQVGG
jgi:hypothetical protein